MARNVGVGSGVESSSTVVGSAVGVFGTSVAGMLVIVAAVSAVVASVGTCTVGSKLLGAARYKKIPAQ